MQQWEYKVITISGFNTGPADREAAINREAAHGWRLIAVTSHFTGHVDITYLYFERSR